MKLVQKERRGFSDPLLLAGAPGSPLMQQEHPLGWVMCFLSVTRVGQQRTANTFFMILGSSVQSRSLKKRLCGQDGQVMSQLFGSSLDKKGHFCHDLGVPEQGVQVMQMSGGG